MPIKDCLHDFPKKKLAPAKKKESVPSDEQAGAGKKKMVVKMPWMEKKRQVFRDTRLNNDAEFLQPEAGKAAKADVVQKQKAIKKKSNIPVLVKKPKVVVKADDDWTLDDLAVELNKVPSLPDGVLNIDLTATQFECPVYARDIIAHLKEKENFYAVPVCFLDKNTQITPEKRAVLVNWLIQVQWHLELQERTLHLSINLMDMYVKSHAIAIGKYQLLGVTSLFVAAKIEERFYPQVDKLVVLTENFYKSDEILVMERRLLSRLNFFIQPPIPLDFLQRFAAVFLDQGRESDMLLDLCNYILEVTLTDVLTLLYPPSLRAAASIYLARYLTTSRETQVTVLANMRAASANHSGATDAVWNPTAVYYSGYAEQQLLACVALFAKNLLNAPQETRQGARVKYCDLLFNSISNSAVLIPSVLADLIRSAS